MGRRSDIAISGLALVACTLDNPAYQATDGASASEAGSLSDSAASQPTTGVSASASASSGSASESGDASSGDASTTTGVSSGPTTSASGETSGEATTGGEATTDGVTTGGESTTGGMGEIFCDPQEQVEVTLEAPVANTYIVSSGGEACQWKDSDNNTLNGVEPCDDLNFGAAAVCYTLIGESEAGRGEMLLYYGVHATMLSYPEYAISSAELEVVPWWGTNRSDVNFTVGVLPETDTWFQGDKAAQIAEEGDSSWKFRKIDARLGALPWSSGVGAAAGSTIAGIINVGELVGGDHPWHRSSPIAGSLLAPWVVDATKEAGLVVSTTIDPILIKNNETAWPPKLHLRLCPK